MKGFAQDIVGLVVNVVPAGTNHNILNTGCVLLKALHHLRTTGPA